MPEESVVPSSVQGEKPAHGKLYWFVYHVRSGTCARFRAHRVGCALWLIAAVLLLFLLRALVHPAAIWLRSHIYILTIGLPVLLAMIVGLRGQTLRTRFIVTTAMIVPVVFVVVFRLAPHQYIALWLEYGGLQKHELAELPLSEFDRIQPQNSIASLANEAMVETETPANPDYVRAGDDYRWTIAIEPAYAIRRLTRGVNALLSVPGDSPSPIFASENRIPVNFATGEGLMLWHNTLFNVVRAFGLWRYFNYEPEEVKYATDDQGNWIQIVTLTRWKGWFFPRPEFGGVQIVRQEPNATLGSAMRRSLVGIGSWVRPEDVSRHSYLRGQNLVPQRVSQYMANSFRYQNGFFAPFPGYHLGDVRIPNMPGDENDQPFTIFFRFHSGEAPDMLYHYFALEPFHEEKQGLNTSLFIPSDGSPVVYTYSHHKRNEALTGVSAIAAKVMESRKNYDWSRNRPVEHRPYIKEIAGKTRFFWNTTVVTLKDEKSRFIAGSTPDVVLTDAVHKTAVWVNALNAREWPAQVEKELGPVWNEGSPSRPLPDDSKGDSRR